VVFAYNLCKELPLQALGAANAPPQFVSDQPMSSCVTAITACLFGLC
jgi:hypothetical protein